jgi:methionyl-tRNA synthetase
MVELREELIERLRESGRLVMGWTVFREDEKEELEKSVYELYEVAMMLKTFEDKKDTNAIIELLQKIYNRIEPLTFEEYKDAFEQAKVKKNIREVIFNIGRI